MSAFDRLRRVLVERRQEVSDLERELAELEVDSDAAPVVDGAAFAAEKLDFEWLVGGMIADRSVTMLVADPGIGKTTFVAQLTLMLTVGRSFLGAPTHARPTLTVLAEGSRAAFRARWNMARCALGIEPPLRWFVQAGHVLDFQLGGRRLEQMIEQTGARLVVLDTLGYFADFNENEARDFKRKVMLPLRSLIQRTGASFLLVHHQPKVSANFNPADRDGRGTGAMLGDADHFWKLDEVKGEPGNLRDLVVRKNKYGRAQDMRLAFDEEQAIFRVIGGA